MNTIRLITTAVLALTAAARAGTVTLEPVADGYVIDDEPNGLFEEVDTTGRLSSWFHTSGEDRAVLEFDLSSIPSGMTITGATLTLRSINPTSVGPDDVCRVHAFAGNGVIDRCDADPTGALVEFTPEPEGGVNTIALPLPLVAGDEPAALRFMLRMMTEGRVNFGSMEDILESWRPKLEITYALSTAGACCVSGACLDALDEDDCAAVGGSFAGVGSTCAGAGCSSDLCSGATPIDLGDTSFSTIGAGTDGPDLPASCNEGAGTTFTQDIWFRYEPATSGTLIVSTCGGVDYDSRLAAYTGSCGDLTIVGCNDDAPGCDLSSRMEVSVSAGTPVLLRVGGFGIAGTGTLTLELTACDKDLDGDGAIGFADLVQLLSVWGECF